MCMIIFLCLFLSFPVLSAASAAPTTPPTAKPTTHPSTHPTASPTISPTYSPTSTPSLSPTAFATPISVAPDFQIPLALHDLIVVDTAGSAVVRVKSYSKTKSDVRATLMLYR